MPVLIYVRFYHVKEKNITAQFTIKAHSIITKHVTITINIHLTTKITFKTKIKVLITTRKHMNIITLLSK